MRLIDVTTFEVQEFFDDDIPRYAILSHRWGREEVSFHQLTSSLEKTKKLAIFQKIQYCADQAWLDGLEWCWVDTCCIDKRSSSELSEAINSMYRWYQNCVKCYAFLQDITTSGPDTNILESEWFTRGWTLQELIAPKDLTFYAANWSKIGGKTEHAKEISKHCGINGEVLRGGSLSNESIAERMRWAAGRETSRIEDVAYSLLGIFDVNMPLLYGEGKNAFLRLQKEIIKTSFDHTIFCWRDGSASRSSLRSLLARSPAEFETDSRVHFTPAKMGDPFLLTNRGLQISLPLQPIEDNPLEYLAYIHCHEYKSGQKVGTAVRLRRVDSGSDQFMRVDPHLLYQMEGNPPPTRVYVLEKIPPIMHIGERAVIYLSFNTENCTAACWATRDNGKNELIRAGPNEVKQHRFEVGSSKSFVLRTLFRSCNDLGRSMLHQVIFNYDDAPLALPNGCDPWGGSLSPVGFHMTAGIPTGQHDIGDVATIDTVQWSKRYGQVERVFSGRSLGDEYVMLMVNLGAPNFQRPLSNRDSTKIQTSIQRWQQGVLSM